MLGEASVLKVTSPLAKYERFATLTLISLIQQGIGADDFLWPRMFFRAPMHEIRSLAFILDQRDGADLVAIRTQDQVGMPIQVKILERGYGATKFQEKHPNVPIVYTHKWERHPPQYAQEYLLTRIAHYINDSPPDLWRKKYYRRYKWMKDHLPWFLRE